jgi:hypothetical protein
MNDLAHGLFEAGLIQFGLFSGGVPVQFRLDMLPSYPVLLTRVAEAALPMVRALSPDHLLATNDSVGLGTALSLCTGVPLVYSRGGAHEAVQDLVGAYDIGHPALVVTGVLDGDTSLLPLIVGARRVGLEARDALAIISAGKTAQDESVRIWSLLSLDAVTTDLSDSGLLPRGQARAVRAWLQQKA